MSSLADRRLRWLSNDVAIALLATTAIAVHLALRFLFDMPEAGAASIGRLGRC